MNEQYLQMMEREMKAINESLRLISNSLEKFVNEGITIYTHEDGPEARN